MLPTTVVVAKDEEDAALELFFGDHGSVAFAEIVGWFGNAGSTPVDAKRTSQ